MRPNLVRERSLETSEKRRRTSLAGSKRKCYDMRFQESGYIYVRGESGYAVLSRCVLARRRGDGDGIFPAGYSISKRQRKKREIKRKLGLGRI